jgi:hypothetical protein
VLDGARGGARGCALPRCCALAVGIAASLGGLFPRTPVVVWSSRCPADRWMLGGGDAAPRSSRVLLTSRAPPGDIPQNAAMAGGEGMSPFPRSAELPHPPVRLASLGTSRRSASPNSRTLPFRDIHRLGLQACPVQYLQGYSGVMRANLCKPLTKPGANTRSCDRREVLLRDSDRPRARSARGTADWTSSTTQADRHRTAWSALVEEGNAR